MNQYMSGTISMHPSNPDSTVNMVQRFMRNHMSSDPFAVTSNRVLFTMNETKAHFTNFPRCWQQQGDAQILHTPRLARSWDAQRKGSRRETKLDMVAVYHCVRKRFVDCLRESLSEKDELYHWVGRSSTKAKERYLCRGASGIIIDLEKCWIIFACYRKRVPPSTADSTSWKYTRPFSCCWAVADEYTPRSGECNHVELKKHNQRTKSTDTHSICWSGTVNFDWKE